MADNAVLWPHVFVQGVSWLRSLADEGIVSENPMPEISRFLGIVIAIYWKEHGIPHLEGEVFEPLREISLFRTARLNMDIDTVVWDNGADMSPDFLYEVAEPVDSTPIRKAAEDHTAYGQSG